MIIARVSFFQSLRKKKHKRRTSRRSASGDKQCYRTVLPDAGYSVTFWNRTPEKSAPLVEAGASVGATPVEAVEASPATIFIIASYRDTLDLLTTMTASLRGKTIMDFAAGNVTDDRTMEKLVTDNGGT